MEFTEEGAEGGGCELAQVAPVEPRVNSERRWVGLRNPWIRLLRAVSSM